MRFVPPVAGLARGTVGFDGDPHMRLRPVGQMLTALAALGVTVDDGGRGALPFAVAGRGSVPGGTVTEKWAVKDSADNVTEVSVSKTIVDPLTLTPPPGFVKTSVGNGSPQTWQGTA